MNIIKTKIRKLRCQGDVRIYRRDNLLRADRNGFESATVAHNCAQADASRVSISKILYTAGYPGLTGVHQSKPI